MKEDVLINRTETLTESDGDTWIGAETFAAAAVFCQRVKRVGCRGM